VLGVVDFFFKKGTLTTQKLKLAEGLFDPPRKEPGKLPEWTIKTSFNDGFGFQTIIQINVSMHNKMRLQEIMQILFISPKHFSIKRKWKNVETYAVYILHTWLPKFQK
jgi:hypothetical protein